jgi:type VI secretion system secreted protein Hcp
MADIYVQIDGIQGEATDSQHQNWVEALSFTHEISQPASATASSAGGGTTARTIHGDYVITKYVDKASPKLYELASTGKHVDKIQIDMLRASGDARVKYLQVDMKKVIISYVAPSGGATPTDSQSNNDHTTFPIEIVKFNYGEIKWTYTQQKRDGTSAGQMTGGWSLIEHKTVA